MKEHAEAAVRREMEEFDRDIGKYRKTGKKQRGAISWWILALIMLAVIYALRDQGAGTAAVLGCAALTALFAAVGILKMAGSRSGSVSAPELYRRHIFGLRPALASYFYPDWSYLVLDEKALMQMKQECPRLRRSFIRYFGSLSFPARDGFGMAHEMALSGSDHAVWFQGILIRLPWRGDTSEAAEGLKKVFGGWRVQVFAEEGYLDVFCPGLSLDQYMNEEHREQDADSTAAWRKRYDYRQLNRQEISENTAQVKKLIETVQQYAR